MCKLFAMTNMEKVLVTEKFINIVKSEVCKHSDRDGFGYAVLGQDGSLGGEKTIKPFSFKKGKNKTDAGVTNSLPIITRKTDAFGHINSKRPKTFIAHARLSTNAVNITNTHPFVNNEVALIHNGVVKDADHLLNNLQTTCDSEILLRYWERGGMSAIENSVSGYYAFMILGKDGKLHVVRDDRAMLYIAYCRTVGSFIIATTKEIIVGVAKKMQWKIETPEEILENIHAVFDGNEVVSHERIAPRVDYNSIDRSLASRALGLTPYMSDDLDGYSSSYDDTITAEEHEFKWDAEKKRLVKIDDYDHRSDAVDEINVSELKGRKIT